MAIGVSNSVTLEPCNQQASLRRLQTRNDRSGLKGRDLRKFKETSLGLKVWMFVNVWELGIFPMWSSIFVSFWGIRRNKKCVPTLEEFPHNSNCATRTAKQKPVLFGAPPGGCASTWGQVSSIFCQIHLSTTKNRIIWRCPPTPPRKKNNPIISYRVLFFTKKCWVSNKKPRRWGRSPSPTIEGGLRVDIIRKALTVETPSACVLAQPRTTQQGFKMLG